MSDRWRMAKEARAAEVGYRCEICGRSDCRIIGHHLISRQKGSAYEVPELCEWRDEDCEREMHERYPGGNGERQKKRIQAYMAIRG